MGSGFVQGGGETEKQEPEGGAQTLTVQPRRLLETKATDIIISRWQTRGALLIASREVWDALKPSALDTNAFLFIYTC